MKTNIKRLTVELEEDVFYGLKSYCVNNKITIKQLLTEIIKKEIN